MTVPTEYEAGLASKSVLKFWISEISLAPTGIRTPDRLACSLVAIQTTLLQLKIYTYMHLNSAVINELTSEGKY